MEHPTSRENWSTVIQPRTGIFRLNFRELWRYRDLLYMFVKRDIVTFYKQTILGPLWFLVQPILVVGMYVIVFNRIAKLSTDGLPPILFYLAGVILWNFFQESFTSTSKTFVDNAALFGKVYFPRIIVPLAKVTSGLIRFLIQFTLFLLVYSYYAFSGYSIQSSVQIALLPAMILIMALLGLGMGVLFSSLTTKYRDLSFLLQFGVQLLMYATPVIYPLSAVPQSYKSWFYINPMTAVFEGFRFAFLGTGTFSIEGLTVSFLSTVLICFTGLVIFNNVERSFMDTV